MTEFKILACDIDGTLAYSDTPVSDEMLEQIEKLQEKYHFVTIGNGNYNRLQEQFISKYSAINDNDMYFFPLGGLEGYKLTKEGTMKLYSNDFTLEEKYEVIEALSDLIREEELIPFTYDQIEDRGSMICLAPIGNKAPKDKKKEYDPDKIKRECLISLLQSKLDPDKYEFKIGGTTHIDITKKGFTKAYGIDKIKEIFDCEYADIMFFGDDLQEGGNDHAVKERPVTTIEVEDPDETLGLFKILNDEEDAQTVVAVSGYFDPIHPGHIEYLQMAKKLGDKLVAILNSDAQCVLKKGKPFMNSDDRKNILEALECVDEVIVSIDTDKSVCKTLELVKPDIFANGGDRHVNEVPETAVCDRLSIQMVDGLGNKIRSSSDLTGLK